MSNTNIPVIVVEGKTLPEVWERAVIKTWKEGINISTEYDKPGDPPSKDCTLIMISDEPLGEPRIHRAFPAGLEDLEIYRQEVVNGIHDHWIDPAEGKWNYTYHQRLFKYEMEAQFIDQINYVIEKLAARFYTRRAQAITWNPRSDPETDHSPCMQRLWCRLVENEAIKGYVLNMNTHWRSRDLYKAAFMNIFALTDLQRWIADEISKKISAPVGVGRYVDISDSAHIYGSYFKEFENFLSTVSKRSFEERTWNTEFAQPFFEEAKKKLEKEKARKTEIRIKKTEDEKEFKKSDI